jgi:hypothetical protein
MVALVVKAIVVVVRLVVVDGGEAVDAGGGCLRLGDVCLLRGTELLFTFGVMVRELVGLGGDRNSEISPG